MQTIQALSGRRLPKVTGLQNNGLFAGSWTRVVTCFSNVVAEKVIFSWQVQAIQQPACWHCQAKYAAHGISRDMQQQHKSHARHLHLQDRNRCDWSVKWGFSPWAVGVASSGGLICVTVNRGRRRDGSYIIEEFLTTGGTDVKVYTVGPRYAHAEARKSPVVDGKVMRSADGKELRYPVLLSPQVEHNATRM